MTIDITDLKNAEAESARLHEKLLQAQKIEAIGILSGGVAHDFNNMIGAIIGNSELTLHQMTTVNPFRKNLEAIRMAQEANDGIDLLITDVVLPQMNGKELENAIQKIRPTLRHL